ncbi:NAD(P)-binding protein, partial [Aureobasidium melanogenum]
MDSKPLILITGANQGLGYYATQQLAATGNYHILLGSRDLHKADKAIESLVTDQSSKVNKADLTPIQIDVTDDESISAAAARVEHDFGSLDMLLNNAGIAAAQSASADQTLRQAYLQQFDTNVAGAAAVTETFLPLLHKGQSKRIAFVSTGLSSLQKADDGSQSVSKFPIYRTTKTALNMVMLYYARTLEDQGFVVGAPAPGFCATNLNNHSGKKDPRDGARLLVEALLGRKEDVHARVFSEGGREPW